MDWQFEIKRLGGLEDPGTRGLAGLLLSSLCAVVSTPVDTDVHHISIALATDCHTRYPRSEEACSNITIQVSQGVIDFQNLADSGNVIAQKWWRLIVSGHDTDCTLFTFEQILTKLA